MAENRELSDGVRIASQRGNRLIPGRNLNTLDWVGIVGCVLIGISISDAVGAQVHASMNFWPAFGIKVAAGGAVTLVLLSVWLGVIRRKS